MVASVDDILTDSGTDGEVSSTTIDSSVDDTPMDSGIGREI